MKAALFSGDCKEVLKNLAPKSAQTCVTSTPYYGLRDYGVDGQIGLESTPDAYVENLVSVFREVRRVLKDDGTLWLNLGDSYSGSNGNGYKQTKDKENRTGTSEDINLRKLIGRIDTNCKPKDLIGIPWMVAFALRADGWYLRSDIVWHKPNPMPESVKDRPTRSHEYIFLLSKSARYFYDYKAILEPANYDGRKDTRMKGSVKYDEQTVARKGGERRPNKMPPIGGVKKANGNNPTYSGNTPDVVYFEDGRPARNKRDVWTINTKPYKGAHFATFPTALIEPCILAGSRGGDIVLDPFNGAGTAGLVALQNGRNYIGIDLNPKYIELTKSRLAEAGFPETDD